MGYNILLEVHNFRMGKRICNTYFTTAEVEFRRWWAYSRKWRRRNRCMPWNFKVIAFIGLVTQWTLFPFSFPSEPLCLNLKIICWGSWVSSEDPMPCWLCQWLLRNCDQRWRLVPSKLQPPANPAPQADER